MADTTIHGTLERDWEHGTYYLAEPSLEHSCGLDEALADLLGKPVSVRSYTTWTGARVVMIREELGEKEKP